MDGMRRVTRPRRWDQPFSPDVGDADIDRALSVLPILEMIDPECFPPTQSLRDIIRYDGRFNRYRRGDIVIQRGDYGSSVFFILRGSVRVVIDRLSSDKPGSPDRQRDGSVLRALGRMLRNPKEPEVRDLAGYRGTRVQVRGHDATVRSFVDDPDEICATRRTVKLGGNQMFGEIAALSRSPRTSTVFAEDDDTELLELRWQGLRELRRRDEAFREWVDLLYMKRGLATHLAESPLFAGLDEDTLRTIAGQTLFQQYGELEWQTVLNRASGSPAGMIAAEEMPIAKRGEYIDGLILIRSGMARVTGQFGETLDCIMTNALFGLEEILDHVRNGADLAWSRSLYAMGCVDALCVPTHVIETQVLPAVPPELLHQLLGSGTRYGISAWMERTPNRRDDRFLLDFFISRRIVNGRRTMLIDTSRCTGCDDCVRACAAGHDNNPRFRRHGPTHGDLMVANACMHCADAVCLIGCPTGAIYREPEGQVVIDDTICIGCGTCAESCPYDNILLVHVRDREGAFVVDEANRPILKATKCDLCLGLPGGPACQRACPHDALIRIVPDDYTTLSDRADHR